jgi:cupin 2 domain-containing protein
MMIGNLLAALAECAEKEQFDQLVQGASFRLERIVSTGQATPSGEWYDQDTAEWVALLSGSAALRFEDEAEDRLLRPGDHVLIAAHRRHRVQWTDPASPTVWLALHFSESSAAD